MYSQTEHSRWGIFGGTLTSVLFNLNLSDVVSTMLLAAIGATVSYTISFLLNRFFPQQKSKSKNSDKG